MSSQTTAQTQPCRPKSSADGKFDRQSFCSALNFQWVYRPGRSNVADPLSRQPAFMATVETDASIFAVITRRASASKDSGHSHALTTEQFLADVEQGYRTDPWFADAANTDSLNFDQGYYRRGSALVIPDKAHLRRLCVTEAHSTPYSGHFGIRRTVKKIKEHFWWPSLTDDVKSYVAACSACQLNKARHTEQKGLLQPLQIPTDRWSSVSMDFITGLPRTQNSKDAILVFVDRLTKMIHLVATDLSIDALGCAQLMLQEETRSSK